MRADIVPGATFPDYELPDQGGRKRKLSELQGDAPLILVLARGNYCPKDRRQGLELSRFHPELKVGYARIVTITDSSARRWGFQAAARKAGATSTLAGGFKSTDSNTQVICSNTGFNHKGNDSAGNRCPASRKFAPVHFWVIPTA